MGDLDRLLKGDLENLFWPKPGGGLVGSKKGSGAGGVEPRLVVLSPPSCSSSQVTILSRLLRFGWDFITKSGFSISGLRDVDLAAGGLDFCSLMLSRAAMRRARSSSSSSSETVVLISVPACRLRLLNWKNYWIFVKYFSFNLPWLEACICHSQFLAGIENRWCHE